MALLLKLIPIFFLCMVKFVLGVPALYTATGWGFLPLFTFASIAGISGVAAFLYFETWLSKMWAFIRQRFFPPKKPKKPAKRFTRGNRILVKVLRSYGLPGLAFITPTLISIPIGTVLAGRLFPNHRKVLLFLSGSVILWSAILSGLLSLNFAW